jgi:two-component sensor histidine kinase
MGGACLLLQGLSFTQLYRHLSPFWLAVYLLCPLVFPLLGPALVIARPAAWRGPLRWLRAAVIACTAVWCALSICSAVATLRVHASQARELRDADRRTRGESVIPPPPTYASTAQDSRIPQGWEFTIWLACSGLGALALKRYRDAQDEATRHRLNATLARDAALRARLAPHFIFNALNTLHAQIEHDPRAAQATTERLAQLFRQVLEVSERATIPLGQELAFVEGYLGIEQVRLGARLRVVIDVPEELEAAEIPPLSLQVLVENAIKHGVGSREEGGLVRVSARVGPAGLTRPGLVLSVEDPGDGRSAGEGTGTALETLRARLERPEDLKLGPCASGYRASFSWGRS